jgi:hypothetical protein
MTMMRFGWMTAVLGLLALGCGGSDDDTDQESAPLEIIGTYTAYDIEQTITADEWNGATIHDYDNDANVVYTQLPDDDEFNPSKFNKIVYTEPEDDRFYFCTVVFDAETLADAKASDATADDSNPAEAGCGGTFPWSLATKN